MAKDDDTTKRTERTRLRIAQLITGAWLISLMADGLPGYDPPAGIHAVMMLAAGWLFGAHILGRDNKGDSQ